MQVLLVEDDARMRALVRRGLSEQGHTVETAGSGQDAVEAASATEFDVLVVDVMLPGFDGVQVVRRLRQAGRRTPVLMLTARDAAADIVTALDAGADDYLVKPFSFAVLLARIRALGRRGPAPLGVQLRVADLTLDPASRAVTRSGSSIHLTRTEYNLLEVLMRRPGRVVTRTALLQAVWGADRDVGGNTLDAFLKSLRHKVDAKPGARLLHTVRGVGYAIRAEAEP